MRGKGLGRALKLAQIARAKELGYRHIAARNRIPEASAMTKLADSLGAYSVFVLDGQYGDPKGKARYYRQPLGRFVPEHPPEHPQGKWQHDLASGLARANGTFAST